MQPQDGSDLVAVLIMAVFFALAFSIPVLLSLAGLIGRLRHRERIAGRRSALAGILLTDLKTFPGGVDGSVPPAMLVSEAVYSADYFIVLVSNLKKIIGGRLGLYTDLATRARDEVTLRLLESARAGGYDAVCNVRIEWADITGTAAGADPRKKSATVSLLATGTAYRRSTTP